MQIPKFAVNTLDGMKTDTRNMRLAALILAMEVPLKADNPFTTQAGDGLSGVRVTWNFAECNPAGLKPGKIIQTWIDEAWCNANSGHIIPKVKRAFAEYDRLKDCARGNFAAIPTVSGNHGLRTNDTRQAAGIIVMGHPLEGKSVSGDVTFWHFKHEAAADLAAWDGYANHHQLPDTDLCILRASLQNHKKLLEVTQNIQYARVTHRGRTAIIGKDASPTEISTIERILYR
jgi:hypothetical protein